MKRLNWLITLPFAIIVIVFAVNNRAPVPLSLWPFDVPATLPTYLVVLGAVLVGFLAGGFAVWLAGLSAKREARRNRSKLSKLERVIDGSKGPPAKTRPTGSEPAPGGDA
ncbi:MAG: lipopolysaccharide assembly LapA domain-containing protein [Alphaproteobacteria bacterium]